MRSTILKKKHKAAATGAMAKRTSFILRYLMASMRLLVLTLMLYVLWFELEGKGQIEEISEPVEHAASNVQMNGDRGGGSGEIAPAAAAVEDTTSQQEASVLEDVKDPAPIAELIELEAGLPYYSLPDGYVALTFDDGPSEYTKDIVDLLVEHEIGATFLFVGRHASRMPELAVYAEQNGMRVGNHSWDHHDLVLLSQKKMGSNIERSNKALEKIVDAPVTLFRPPYGSMDERLMDAVADMDMKLLMWNRDPKDWKARSAEEVVQYFRDTNPSGGIYVLHEKKVTLEALPAIIRILKKKELKFAVFQ